MHGHQADERAQREHAAGQERRDDRADERERQRQEHERREPSGAEVGQQNQEDGRHGADAEQVQAGRRGLPLGVLAQHLGVVALLEREAGELRLDVAGDGAEIATAHVRRHVDAA